MGPAGIPELTRRAAAEASADRATVLLLRHAERGPIPVGHVGNDVRLVASGKRLSRELGRQMGSRLATLHSSPVPRCMETAEAIAAGAGTPLVVVEDRHLGDPGVYVEHGEVAWAAWVEHGHEGVMAKLVEGVRLPGMAEPRGATARLIEHLRRAVGGAPGLHVFVSHDSLVAPAAAHTLALSLGEVDAPRYLEALVLEFDLQGFIARYRGWSVWRPY